MKEEIILKHYNNEDINRELRKMFERAVKDEEYLYRFECGGDFKILMDDIDKTLKYVESGYKGTLYLNSNIWYVCQETLVNILALYGLKLIGTNKCTENEEVIIIRNPLKEKIFKKMREYGWNLGNNNDEDFAIKLLTKNSDEIIIIKNPKGNTFDEIYKNILNKKVTNFRSNDNFMMPVIDFNVLREYVELENKEIKTLYGIYMIDKAIQSIKFSLDEKGGKVKSEAGMDVIFETAVLEDKSRNFYVNDTFALFLKESNKDKPYFALRVDDISKFQQ